MNRFDVTTRPEATWQRVGGVAALYLALALLAAIPYFLLVVDYPGAKTTGDKVALVVDNYPSMFGMYLATYALFGVALSILVLALWDRLKTSSRFTARVATVIGLLWSFALVASGLVFMYGMTVINDLAATDEAQAVVAWRAMEPVALALGGAGGELLGGLWVLLVSVVILRNASMPRMVGGLGVGIGVVGIASVVPPLRDAAMAFGTLQIAWLGWLGVILLATREPTSQASLGRESRAELVGGRRP